MLINVVESSKRPKRSKFRPSLVGLRPIECCPDRFRFGNVDLSAVSASEFCADVDERELSAIMRFAMLRCDGPGQMVERTSEVMQAISEQDRPVRWRLLGYLHAIEAMRRLRIVLWNGSVEFGGQESPDLGIQHVEVLFCPREFLPASMKQIRHG